MKVERKENAFNPVIITLTSQEEVDALWDLLGQVNTDSTPLEGLYEILEGDGHTQATCAYTYFKI